MTQTIRNKRSSISERQPEVDQIMLGEISINTYDGYIYIKKDNGVEIIVKFDPVEYGGRIWENTKQYYAGDIISHISSGDTNSYLYISIADNINSSPDELIVWQRLVTKGILYDSTVQYRIGDIISYNNDIYIVPENPQDAGNPPPVGSVPGDLSWPDITTEVGGLIWTEKQNYQIGDIVSEDGGLFTCVTDHQATLGNVGSGSPLEINQNSWARVHPNNTFDTSRNYKAGDIVTIPTTGDIFIAPVGGIPASATIPTLALPGNWLTPSTVERGGVAWDTNAQYLAGDIVTNTSTIPMSLWIAIVSNTGVIPTLGNTWEELGSPYYNASTGGDSNNDGVTDGGQHNPNSTIGEYPITSDETEGANWYINGLGRDEAGNSNTYTFTTGSLTGIKVIDLDRLIWSNTLGSDPVWLHVPLPTVVGERGGVLWRNTKNYIIGDIVTQSGLTYVCINDAVSGGISPELNTNDWKPILENIAERGGVLWNGTIFNYVKGDIVTEVTGILGEEQQYICITDVLADVLNMLPSLDTTNINWIEYDTYTNNKSVPTAVGGIEVGETFDKISHDALFTRILYPYMYPSTTNLDITTYGTILEVGDSVDTLQNFTWTISNPENIDAGVSWTITDVTGSNELGTLSSNNSTTNWAFPWDFSVSPITKTDNVGNTWRVTGKDTKGNSVTDTTAISWRWRSFWANSTSATYPTPAEIILMAGNKLATSEAGEYTFAAGASNYRYLCYSTDFGLATTFKDKATGFAVAMDSASPTTVGVTNDFGVTSNYYVYRTQNASVASLTIIVA